MTPAMRPQILDAIWPANLSHWQGVFAVLDGARDRRIYSAVNDCRLDRCCLYSGDLPWQLQMTAPYLVHLDREDRFTKFLLDTGWGNSWGIFARSEVSMTELRRHLRGFLRVRDEAGRRLLFRYYDPRVLRMYLPTCWPQELQTVFGPVDSYLMESEDQSNVLEFRMSNGALAPKRSPLTLVQPEKAFAGRPNHKTMTATGKE